MFVEENYDVVDCKHDDDEWRIIDEKWNVIRIEEKWITNNSYDDDETGKVGLKRWIDRSINNCWMQFQNKYLKDL